MQCKLLKFFPLLFPITTTKYTVEDSFHVSIKFVRQGCGCRFSFRKYCFQQNLNSLVNGFFEDVDMFKVFKVIQPLFLSDLLLLEPTSKRFPAEDAFVLFKWKYHLKQIQKYKNLKIKIFNLKACVLDDESFTVKPKQTFIYREQFLIGVCKHFDSFIPNSYCKLILV